MLKKALIGYQFHPVILFQEKSIWLDLSQSNNDLLSVDVSNAVTFSSYINQLLEANNAKIAVGGYNEKRNIYKRSRNFNSSEQEERFIHLGVDLWTKVETPIYCPIDGVFHSLKNNKGLGNYGPTIILQHNLDDISFYTLYGHLTLDSLTDKYENQAIKAGEPFAKIGNFPINGDYPPHLHFQIIKDLKGMKGDFPGVTSLSNQKEDLENCPDPNLILKINC